MGNVFIVSNIPINHAHAEPHLVRGLMERGGWHEQRFIMRMVGSIPLRVLLYYCVAVVATALDSNEPRLPELIYNVSQSSIWTW